MAAQRPYRSRLPCRPRGPRRLTVGLGVLLDGIEAAVRRTGAP
ncbi:hypothetical protein OHA88_19710 [Streptomyces sp. NBC_00353]